MPRVPQDTGSTRFGRLAGRCGTALRRSRGGVAALEFALLAPVMVMMSAGLYDLTMAFITWQRVNMAALAIDEIATSMAANSATTNSLSLSQATSAASAVYAFLPDTLKTSPPAFGVTLSSIVMTPTGGGAYSAHVAWSGSFQGTGTLRPCDLNVGQSVIATVPDTADPAAGSLPADAFSAASLLVVDVVYTFRPVFAVYITGNVTMRRAAYFSPRAGLAGDWIKYVYSAPDATQLCPNYPKA